VVPEKLSSWLEYAAAHWVAHAQDKKVRSSLRKAMEYLFDLDKPYFAAWLRIVRHRHFIPCPSQHFTGSHFPGNPSCPRPTPLYYAALCGFQDLVEHLINNNPELVNASGRLLCDTALSQHCRGGIFRQQRFSMTMERTRIRGVYIGNSPLHSAALYARFEMVQILFNYKADVNARSD
jgi:hypothetical protein